MKRAGITNYEFRHGGRHPRVVWLLPDGQERFYTFPGSLSDGQRGLQNLRSGLRKALNRKFRAGGLCDE